MSDTESAIRAMAATVAFLKAEGDLLQLNANERSITHKLAEYLQREFSDWNVDCEYNRLGAAIKRLPAPEAIGSDDEDGRTIFPDIIVHRRNIKRQTPVATYVGDACYSARPPLKALVAIKGGKERASIKSTPLVVSQRLSTFLFLLGRGRVTCHAEALCSLTASRHFPFIICLFLSLELL